MNKKSDYAIIISCNPGYGFGMISTMNAMKHFGTDADWEVAYEGYTEEERHKISGSFPFNVNWTPVSELMSTVVDNRSNKEIGPLNRMWLSYWLLPLKLLREKKYKAVCVIQADCFVFVNLDVYFKMAENGIIVSGEHAFSWIEAEDMPFGDDKAIWDRSMCAIFDNINFMNGEHIDLIEDIINFQCEDSFKGEANHSVIALNRAVCKHGKRGKILGLDRRLWTCDCIWPETDLRVGPDGFKIYNSDNIPLSAWHCRWWQKGRCVAEFANNIEPIKQNSGNKDYMDTLDRNERNFNVVKSFMEKFNAMTPDVASEDFAHGAIVRPKYELGEV
ncbi:MAG: hypothetical protein P9M07_02595 [Candidatus Aceula meridiana]|nr:hypothetical protein [Candidatus Aceula meridiana]